jgi:hypothetical protein
VEINFQTEFSVTIEEPNLKSIIEAFTKLLPLLLTDFFQKILLGFAELYMSQETKPFCCSKCGNNKKFTWKTREGEKTEILTVFQMVVLNQMQIKCKECGHKFYLARLLLGVEPRKTIPAETRRKLGLIGSLASFRVSAKIVSLFGWTLNKMTIWRAVQETAKEIEFGIDPKELPHGEADGTGIPIQGIKKRGKEMKVFVQLKKTGGVRIAGLSIGNYDGGWDKLFKPLRKAIKAFNGFLLVTDGDTSIFKGMGKRLKVKLQRCLWHIPHQLKYYLWKDKVERKSAMWKYVLTEVLDICAIRSGIDDKDIIDEMILKKEARVKELIKYCEDNALKQCATHLKNAEKDMFTGIKNRFTGKTSSNAERVMRTINLRVNVGKWSQCGALNAVKIRLAYYYNGFDVV